MAAPVEAAAGTGIVGRARRASLSVLNANPQLGVWQAAGTAIGHAPNLTELRDVELGGENISFNAQGHSTRVAAIEENTGEFSLVRSKTSWSNPTGTILEKSPVITQQRSTLMDESSTEATTASEGERKEEQARNGGSHHHHHHHHHRHHHLFKKHHEDRAKAKWGPTIMSGLKAFWKFFRTPSGFLITIYALNVVAWGAMLFFLLLKAAPAMNHPSADDDSSPRKIWLEIDSQILNALFCVTGFGLAPWRFRDAYWFVKAAHFKNAYCMKRLYDQNKSWFRPPAWATEEDETLITATFTGKVAPPTPLWKLGFTIWMMVLNTILQAVLCYFMWGFNRINRPGWATGCFIGLGCGVAMFAGLMSWWESRRVKKIEGPAIKIVQEEPKS